MVKRTDLELIFGRGVTQKSPLFFHNAQRRNRIIGSLKADLLKSPIKQCPKCNGALTQPYDNAWTTFISFLYNRNPDVTAGDVVRADRIFSQSATARMLNVHLYFVKHMGDRLRQGQEIGHDFTFDVDSLSRPLRAGKASPNVYLRFGCGMHLHVGASDLRTAINTDTKQLHAADWYYLLGGLAVQLIYAAPNYPHPALASAWHPRQGTNRLEFYDFDREGVTLPAGGIETITTSKPIG